MLKRVPRHVAAHLLYTFCASWPALVDAGGNTHASRCPVRWRYAARPAMGVSWSLRLKPSKESKEPTTVKSFMRFSNNSIKKARIWGAGRRGEERGVCVVT
jgi:hypothetical protein